MKINKIEINNFRLLKNLKLDLEEDLSLVIGKNNTGIIIRNNKARLP